MLRMNPDVQNTIDVTPVNDDKQIYACKELTCSMVKSDDLFNASEPNDESHHDKYNYGEKLINFTIDSLKEFNIEVTDDTDDVKDDIKPIYACIIFDFIRASEKRYVEDQSDDVQHTVDVTYVNNDDKEIYFLQNG